MRGCHPVNASALSAADTMSLQNDIWTIELYRKKDGGYSILLTLDLDELWIVCDFEDVGG